MTRPLKRRDTLRFTAITSGNVTQEMGTIKRYIEGTLYEDGAIAWSADTLYPGMKEVLNSMGVWSPELVGMFMQLVGSLHREAEFSHHVAACAAHAAAKAKRGRK